MNILGVELELDLFDADVIEVYEKENKRVVDRIQDNGRYEGKSTAESIRYQCGIVNDFFDSLFGAGTAEKIFKGKSNIKDHMEAFGIVAKAAEDSNVEFNGVLDKYTPNRAERRQAEKQQQKQGSRSYQRNFAAVNGKKGGKHGK